MRKLLYACALLLVSSGVFAQEMTVSGVVTDAVTNDPVPGVNISIKGTNFGTTSGIDGRYQLNASTNDVLVFSFIGYRSVERTVTGQTLNVQLEEDATQLNEVVVIGYGTTTVEDATGAITSITEEDFNQGNIVTPENLLNGRVAGLTINTGGAPGGGSTIRIRGGSSLDASNDPLIVINGLPIENTAVGGAASVLSSINPNDIESFTVLKDASATAIYGSRAANGVIIITTKEASKEFQLTFDARTAFGTLPNKIEVFNAAEFRELIAEYYPEDVDMLGDANTDWQDEIYQNSLTTSYNLAAEGNVLGKVPVRVSVGRTDQEGLRLTSKYERTAASLNMSPSLLDDHLNVSLNANYVIEENRFASGQEGSALLFDPTQPVYVPGDENWGGFFQYVDPNPTNFSALLPWNPVANLLLTNDASQVNRFYGNLKLDYMLHFFPDVSINVNLGIDDQSGEGSILRSDLLPIRDAEHEDFRGSESFYTSDRVNYLLDTYFDYNKKLGNNNIDAILGYSYQRFESGSFTSGELRNDREDTEPINYTDTDLVLIGFFARTNIAFNENYLLTLSYRRDGTSRFSPENRWGDFPSAAFAWKVGNQLFPDAQGLSTLKLRLGWGITGQQDIGNGNRDLYLSRYVIGRPNSQYRFGDEVIPVGVPASRNEELKWEETTTWNVGLDYGIWDERFTGSLEAFYKVSDDLLAYAAISDGSNFSNAGFQNIGKFTSRGLEFALNGDIVRSTSGINWNVNFNATVIKTKIDELALDNEPTGGIGGGTGGTVQIRRVGFDPRAFYVYKQVYNEDGKPIEGAYVDLNGDNQINENDRYIPGDATPNVMYGFMSNLSYKNFDFSFNFRANIGNYVYNNVNSARAQTNFIRVNPVLNNLPVVVRDTEFQNTDNVVLSDYYIEDGSFLRMDNITLGYTFEGLLNDNISSLRISAGVENAFIITNYSGLDPEIFGGIDNTIYPRPRTFYAGLNVRL